ncbi:MAG TPA: hypothetical protein ENJ73_02850 [Desulfobacterales bacterium]|nr:hypothetical protein [Desulfobacterales bacterium]
MREAEEKVAGLETRKAELERQLADPDTYHDQARFASLSKEYAEVERRLHRWLDRWEERQAKLEKAQAQGDA